MNISIKLYWQMQLRFMACHMGNTSGKPFPNKNMIFWKLEFTLKSGYFSKQSYFLDRVYIALNYNHIRLSQRKGSS